MLRILTVCTGNICRSPLAEQLLRLRLADLGVEVSSAGTRAPASRPMTPEARHLAVHLGVPEADADAHRARLLTEAELASPDLIVAMTREHRRAIVELAPARLRATFTARELARLAADLPSHELADAIAAAGDAPADRLRAALAAAAARRGLTPPLDDPADDDVRDPYLQPWEVYQQSAAQLVPALSAVAALVRTAVSR